MAILSAELDVNSITSEALYWFIVISSQEWIHCENQSQFLVYCWSWCQNWWRTFWPCRVNNDCTTCALIIDEAIIIRYSVQILIPNQNAFLVKKKSFKWQLKFLIFAEIIQLFKVWKSFDHIVYHVQDIFSSSLSSELSEQMVSS